MADKKKTITETQTISPNELELINNHIGAPTLFVDGGQGFLVVNGNATISLYQYVQDMQKTGSDSPIKKLVVARLTMPVTAAKQIGDFLVKHSSAAISPEDNDPQQDG